MNNETSRVIGIVFEQLSVNDAAKKCANLAWYWGGAATVYCNRSGMVVAVAPGTIDAKVAESRCGNQIVGTYSANSRKHGREIAPQIAEDIWHHLLDAVGPESPRGIKLRAAVIGNELLCQQY